MCLPFVACVIILLDSAAPDCELVHSVMPPSLLQVLIEHLLCARHWIFILKAMSYSSLHLLALAQLLGMLVGHNMLRTIFRQKALEMECGGIEGA